MFSIVIATCWVIPVMIADRFSAAVWVIRRPNRQTGLGRLIGDEVTYFFQVFVTARKNRMFCLQGRVGLKASDSAYRIVIKIKQDGETNQVER